MTELKLNLMADYDHFGDTHKRDQEAREQRLREERKRQLVRTIPFIIGTLALLGLIWWWKWH
jgi:hypothetical protein